MTIYLFIYLSLPRPLFHSLSLKQKSMLACFGRLTLFQRPKFLCEKRHSQLLEFRPGCRPMWEASVCSVACAGRRSHRPTVEEGAWTQCWVRILQSCIRQTSWSHLSVRAARTQRFHWIHNRNGKLVRWRGAGETRPYITNSTRRDGGLATADTVSLRMEVIWLILPVAYACLKD